MSCPECNGSDSVRFKWDTNADEIIIIWTCHYCGEDMIYNKNSFALSRKKEIFYSDFYIPSVRYWTSEEVSILKENMRSQKNG